MSQDDAITKLRKDVNRNNRVALFAVVVSVANAILQVSLVIARHT